MKLIVVLVFFFVIQSRGDQDDGKNAPTIDDPCTTLAHEYNEVAQKLFAYKRDFYIVICLIVGFSTVAIIMFIMKRRQQNEPLRCTCF
jgi:hypothetical protein